MAEGDDYVDGEAAKKRGKGRKKEKVDKIRGTGENAGQFQAITAKSAAGNVVGAAGDSSSSSSSSSASSMQGRENTTPQTRLEEGDEKIVLNDALLHFSRDIMPSIKKHFPEKSQSAAESMAEHIWNRLSDDKRSHWRGMVKNINTQL